ncbi:MAG: ammonium transporter [Candidatus Desantisbacteria bacterium]
MLGRLFISLSLMLFSSSAYAEEIAGGINGADTGWLLISTALVMLMIPGLGLFYGGMVRRKNVLATLMGCLVGLYVVGLQWVLFGYSLAFGPDKNGLIGGLEWIGLTGVGLEPSTAYATTVPHQAFMVFQAMFACITPGLIIGAFAERIKFSSLLIFILLWTTLVYDPVCHWVWGSNGWLAKLGCVDFAGGLVVHLSSGIAALVACLMMGKRKGYRHQPMSPHNLPMTILGTGLLWFGWFGFNAGSSLSSGTLAVSAFVATNIAASAAALTWMLIEWKHKGSPTVLGGVSGAVAGLATITPASGFVNPMSAVIIGIAAGIICYICVSNLKPKLGYDDSLDVFGIHGVAGICGTLAVGLFAQTAINPAGPNGFFFGNPAQLGIQALGVIVVAAYTLVITWILLKAIDMVIGLRVSKEDEVIGLDLSQHSECGYTIID